MKKSEVNICDVCRDIITDKKCEICDKDICKNCEDDMEVKLAEGGCLFFIISCEKCSKKLERSKLKNYFENKPHTQIRKDLLKVFRNAIVVENLQNDDDDNEIESHKKFRRLRMMPHMTPNRSGWATEITKLKQMKGGKIKTKNG